MKPNSLIVLFAAGLASLATAKAAANTLSGETAAADSSRVVDLDEVVVVAQPKEQVRLRLQPVSSAVFGTDEMHQLQVRDLRDLSQYVPSFVMPAYGSRYTSSMYVRGIGSRVNNPAVGLYMDNVPLLSKSMHNFHAYQLQRVDVLRGPQGTLYGQNSEGGLVRLYSPSPLSYQGTDIRLGVASGFYRNVELAHYAKLSDQLSFSAAAFYEGQNGFFRNTATDERADRYNEGGAKARLVWQPTERLTLSLLADYQYVDQNGFPYGLLDPESGEAEDPSTNRQGTYDRHSLCTGLDVTYHAKGFDLNSVSSWQYLKDNMLMDIDYLADDYMHMQQHQLQQALTEELTLKSRNQSVWHWTTGLFASRQWQKTDAPVFFGSEMNRFLSKTIEDYAYYGMLNAMAARMGMDAAKAMIERAGGCHITMSLDPIPGLFHTPQTNLGLFHESNIDITARLTATLGLRYDYSHVGIDYQTSAIASLSESVMGTNVEASVASLLKHSEKNDYNQLLPKLGLTYRFDNHGSNVYAVVAKGYRAGGFNIQMFSDILQTELQSSARTVRGAVELTHDDEAYANIRETIAFKPEESWNYECGTHVNLFENRLHVDLSAYYMQVRNQQLSVMAGNYGFGRMMVSAGRSYSCGLELAVRGAALENHLTYTLGYGYTRAVFKEYKDSVMVNGVNEPVDYADNRVPYVPEHTFCAAADYRFDIGGFDLLKAVVVGANVTGQGKTWWDEANTYSQGVYATLGAHADIVFKNLTLSLWGRNLTDTNYNIFSVGSAATGSQLYFAQRGNPLQLGLDVRIHL